MKKVKLKDNEIPYWDPNTKLGNPNKAKRHMKYVPRPDDPSKMEIAFKCQKCKVMKHYGYYSKDKGKDYDLDTRCNKCEYPRKKIQNIERQNKDYLKELTKILSNQYVINNGTKYGRPMTAHDALVIAKKQNWKCVIDKTKTIVLIPPIVNGKREKRKWCVDHDHKKKFVRGIISKSNYNAALGFLKDDPKLMRTSADYIEQSKKDPLIIVETETKSKLKGFIL